MAPGFSPASRGSLQRLMHIARSVIDALVAHARATHPCECCGLLIGTPDAISRAWPAANLADRPTRFHVDPRDHFAALRAARADGLHVVGAYHSHPTGPATPSDNDLVEANDPSLLHVIVVAGGTSDEPEVRAFHLDRGNIREVRLVPEG